MSWAANSDIRRRHYSLKKITTSPYSNFVFLDFVIQKGSVRLQKKMEIAEVEAFITTPRFSVYTSTSTQCALLFIPRCFVSRFAITQQIGRLPQRKCIPVVLPVTDVQIVLGFDARGAFALWDKHAPQ